MTILKATLMVVATLFAVRWVVPQILHQVVSLRIRELFVITIVLLCLGTALVSDLLGLSLALGAFLAGMIISESEYSSQAMADILPFKESFSGICFISPLLGGTEIYLLKEGSKADGYTLKGLDLRANTGATVVAVQRKDQIHQNPPADFILKTGDAILIIGRKNEVRQAVACLKTGSFCVIDSDAPTQRGK